MTLTTPPGGKFVILRLILCMANWWIKFEVSSFSHSKDIPGGVKFKNWSRNHDHAPIMGGLSSTWWDPLWLASPVMGIWHTHTHTQLCNGLFSRTTWVGRYQKDKPILIFLNQRWRAGSDNSWTIRKSFTLHFRQTTMPAHHQSNFLRAGCSSCRPTNSIKALKADTKYAITW